MNLLSLQVINLLFSSLAKLTDSTIIIVPPELREDNIYLEVLLNAIEEVPSIVEKMQFNFSATREKKFLSVNECSTLWSRMFPGKKVKQFEILKLKTTFRRKLQELKVLRERRIRSRNSTGLFDKL